MGDSHYKRVSRKNPCRICGKPDWCSRTADDSVSFCARITEGANRLSRKEQWGVFYHDRSLLSDSHRITFESKNYYQKSNEQVSIAPLEIRDFVYSSLLRLSPADRFQIITDGANGLRNRGLNNFKDYGCLPPLACERKELASQLRLLLFQNYPHFIREYPRGMAHIPGFWLSDEDVTCLWIDKDYSEPMLIIPYRNPAGRIQACQLRFTGAIRQNQKRYLWLSTPKNHSAGTGTPIHSAVRNNNISRSFDKPILVTEGALKADVVSLIRPDYYVIANSGVACAHELIVNISRSKKMCIAFDNDYQENEMVIRQLSSLLKSRLDDCHAHQTFCETRIISWTRQYKGIDDALLDNQSILELNIPEWLDSLSSDYTSIVREICQFKHF